MSDNNNLVSVIVPVYKVEKFLPDCLDSIINQTYKNLEILLVDDGSPDRSGAICEEYARKDPRITVYHTENKGQSHARNYALDRCRGDYITFIDSDDIAKINYVEKLYTLMKDYNADMSAISVEKFSNSYEGGGGYNKIEIFCLPPQEILRGLLYQSKKAPHTGPHCKLFKRKAVENVRFPVGLIYEDLATTYRFISQCDRVVFSTEKLYLYRVYFGSTMRQNYTPKMLSCIQVSQGLYSDISKQFPELEKAAASRAFSVNRAIYFQIPRALKQERKQVWQEMKKYRKTVIFDPHARKRERLAAILSYSGPEIFHLFAGLYRRWQMRS